MSGKREKSKKYRKTIKNLKNCEKTFKNIEKTSKIFKNLEENRQIYRKTVKIIEKPVKSPQKYRIT